MSGLEIKNLYVSVHEKQIIENFSLTVPKGEIHAIMGPNGTGKSTLSYTIMGHPAYKASAGDILMNGERINDWTPAFSCRTVPCPPIPCCRSRGDSRELFADRAEHAA